MQGRHADRAGQAQSCDVPGSNAEPRVGLLGSRGLQAALAAPWNGAVLKMHHWHALCKRVLCCREGCSAGFPRSVLLSDFGPSPRGCRMAVCPGGKVVVVRLCSTTVGL